MGRHSANSNKKDLELESLEDRITPTNAQLARATPVQLFKRGELAMVAGFRNLVPELREAEDLSFDVLPMPTIDPQIVLRSAALRTQGFTSADAAGLPIFPGLVRYDEVAAGAPTISFLAGDTSRLPGQINVLYAGRLARGADPAGVRRSRPHQSAFPCRTMLL